MFSFKVVKLYIKTLISTIIKIFKDIPVFGFKIAHYNFRGTFANSNLLPFNLNIKIKQKRNKLVNNFLELKYSTIIKEYKNKSFNPLPHSRKIRCFRWQGIDKAPDLVKICINSVKKHAGNYELIVLDKKNYMDYVSLPDFIIKKFENKEITITHLSDIIRIILLKEYGGIWMDATMYITRDIFSSFDDTNFNSNYPDKYVKNVGGFEKWCIFFMGGKSHTKLLSFMYDFLMQYYKDYNLLINYFLTDYIINIAYNHFDECKKDINSVSFKNNDVFTLQQIFNQKYEKKKYDNLMKFGFFKLTYKHIFNKCDKYGNLTNYGNFIQDNL